MGRELESGRFRAVFVWAHNPAVVCPETVRVRARHVRDDGFGMTAMFAVPGAGQMMLYEPRHPTAFDIADQA